MERKRRSSQTAIQMFIANQLRRVCHYSETTLQQLADCAGLSMEDMSSRLEGEGVFTAPQVFAMSAFLQIPVQNFFPSTPERFEQEFWTFWAHCHDREPDSIRAITAYMKMHFNTRAEVNKFIRRLQIEVRHPDPADTPGGKKGNRH